MRTKFNNRPCTYANISISMGTAKVKINLSTINPVTDEGLRITNLGFRTIYTGDSRSVLVNV